jgi:hypothetical protein
VNRPSRNYLIKTFVLSKFVIIIVQISPKIHVVPVSITSPSRHCCWGHQAILVVLQAHAGVSPNAINSAVNGAAPGPSYVSQGVSPVVM